MEYICTRSVGYDHIDVDRAASLGISVENVGYSPDSVADYTLMLMLMVVRGARSTVIRVQVHDYRLNDRRGRELRDLTVGVVGTGRIGVAVMERLRGFGCTVLAHDRDSVTTRPITWRSTHLLAHSDVVTLHTPLDASTHHLLDRRRIEMMKPGAFIINTGRGSLLDTGALLAALEGGRLGGAALDVIEGEEGIFYSDLRQEPVGNDAAVAAATAPERADHAAHRLLHRSCPARHRRGHPDQLPALRERSVMDRLRVAVLFGGCSEEHPISVKSAEEVAKNLDPERYEPFYIGITRAVPGSSVMAPAPNWETDRCRPAVLSPDRDAHGLLVLEQGRYEAIRLDVVLPVLHGKHGEDGAIQGLLELSGIPYVGCDVQSSALCMDKAPGVPRREERGIATPKFRTLTADEDIDADGLTYPVFVKPARSGSSFGVSKVDREEDLPSAVATARRYDSKVLIEEAVVGREVGCAMVGNGSTVIAGEPDRVSLSHGFFRIHQEEQPELGSENATFIVPADISAEARARVHETARVLYRALGCRGLARVDLFLKEDETVVLNEVNTLPGMTSYSRYPRMMAAAGLSLADVIDRLVSLALSGT